MKAALLRQLAANLQTRQTAVAITNIGSGTHWIADENNLPSPDDLREAYQKVVGSGRAMLLNTDAGEVFLNPQVPAPRIIVIGAVHIAQHLIGFADALGFDAVIIDPRSGFASKDRFPAAQIHAVWPEDIWHEIAVDDHTAVVALTHDPKIDDFALESAVRSRAFYVGALGSRRTHAKRCDRLVLLGCNAEQLARIDAPIGLDIGAANPGEIALSVIAAIVEAWRGRGQSKDPTG
jgi:xanthine dehydrogenase accessory factor